LISQFASGQNLIINEVSQGPTGSKEYVELLTIPTNTTQNCVTCMDLRGWIIDDNNGYFSNGVLNGTGVAGGAVRFSNNTFWSCIPFGTIIVIYNQADLNASIPAQDASMIDGNCRLILPVNSNLLEYQTTSPSTTSSTYPTTGWLTGGSLWSPLGMSNSDDSFQIYAPGNTLVPTFGVSWGNNNSNNIIYFAGGVGNTVLYFGNVNSNDPNIQSNWVSGTCSNPNEQTPGLPNNAANTLYISQLNNSCSTILPLSSTSIISDETCSCNGSVTISPSGAIPGYTYSWTDATNSVIGQSATLTNLCAGTYNCRITSLNGCIYDTSIVIPSNPSILTPTFNPIGPICSGTNFSLPTTSLNGIVGSWSPAIENTSNTTYTFTPANSSCATTTSLTVVVDQQTIPTFTQIGPNCIGDIFTLPTTSTNGIQGTWSPALNFSQTTTYTFTPTNTTCTSNSTMTVTVNACGLNQETCFKRVTFTQVIASSCLVGADVGDEDPAISIWCNNSLTTLLYGTEWTLNIPASGTYNLPANPWNACQQNTNTWSVGAIPSSVQSLNVFVQTYESNDSNCQNPMSNSDGCRASANHTMDLSLGTHLLDIGGSLSYRYTVTETTLVSNVALSSINCNGNTYDANLIVTYLNPNTPCGLGGNLGNLIVNGQSFAVTGSPQTITLTNLPSNGLAVNINAYFSGDYAACQFDANAVYTAPIPPTLVSFTGGGSYCPNENPNNVSVNVSGTSPFSATYTLNGQTNTVQSTTNPFSLGNLPGEYILTNINAGGCATTVSETEEIIISNTIAPTFTQVGPFCIGDVYTLPTTSNNNVQGTWSPAINNNQTTTYTFTPLNSSCATSTTMTVVVSNGVTPTFAPINPICINGTAPTLPTTSTNGISGIWSPSTISTTNAGNFNFTFSPNSGQCATIISQNITVTNPITPNFSVIGPFCLNSAPTPLPAQSIEGITGTWSPNTINTSTLGTNDYIFTPSNGFCAANYTANVFIGDNSVNAGLDQTICLGQSITLSAQGTPPFVWNNSVLDGIPFSPTQSATYTVSSTQNGCTASDNVTVNVVNPQADFTFSPQGGTAPINVTFSNTSQNSSSYYWDFGNGLNQNTNSINDVNSNYTLGGTYTVTLISNDGNCSNSISYELIILPDLTININTPNVFSPNGDNVNNVYTLNVLNSKNLEAKIFNRWGNVVFEMNQNNLTWDGTSNGIDCAEGVYFIKYKVVGFDDKTYEGQQFIHLLR